MADYKVTDTELASIANAIRTKGGTSEQLEFPTEFISAVNAISGVTAADEGKVVSNGVLVAQTSTTVTQNGTVDTTLNDEVVVNVSGGGETQIEITPVVNSAIGATFSGHCVVSGRFVKLTGRVNVTNTATGNRVYLTIPEGYRPAGYYKFQAGKAGGTTRYLGHVSPSGEVVCNCKESYFNLDVSWVIPDSIVAFTTGSAVTSSVGSIAVCGDIAYLNAKIEATGSDGWISGLIVLPNEVKATSNIVAFVETDAVGSYAIFDASGNTSEINVYLSSGTKTLVVSASWLIDRGDTV